MTYLWHIHNTSWSPPKQVCWLSPRATIRSLHDLARHLIVHTWWALQRSIAVITMFYIVLHITSYQENTLNTYIDTYNWHSENITDTKATDREAKTSCWARRARQVGRDLPTCRAHDHRAVVTKSHLTNAFWPTVICFVRLVFQRGCSS